MISLARSLLSCKEHIYRLWGWHLGIFEVSLFSGFVFHVLCFFHIRQNPERLLQKILHQGHPEAKHEAMSLVLSGSYMYWMKS